MSELPRTDDLPRSDDGFDPARVEEAFASFAERVHELESVAVELRAELRELRADRRTAPPPQPYADDEDWPVDATFRGRGPAPDWVASVPPPLLRPVAVPRVVLEGAFLLAVALLAGLADLDAVWIVVVMATAWALVALSEWTAAAKRARWHLEEVAPSVASDGDSAESTGPWSMPVVEATAVAVADDSESRTMIAALPADAGAEPTDEEAEPEPARRRFRLRRHRPATSGAADPWEQ
jgi:hypothetical protein